VCRRSDASACVTTTDLGQAIIDGKFDHAGKLKGPILRGLSARAPYFHNGSAQTLLDVVRCGPQGAG
jgi:cytochrome c peroxidase